MKRYNQHGRMARAITRTLLLASVLACKAPQPCDDAALQHAVERVHAAQTKRPWRIGSPAADTQRLDWDLAAEGILAACPELPGRSTLGDAIDFRDNEDWRAATLRMCPAWDTLRATEPRSVAMSWRAVADEVYATCDLGRFELIDPVQFGLGGMNIEPFVAYDLMLRQGGDAALARELSRALLWQSAWAIESELPSATIPIGGPFGEIGVRVTSRGFDIRSGAGERALADVVAEVEPWLTAQASAAEDEVVLDFGDARPRVILVADADATVGNIVAISDALVARGANTVSVLTADPRGAVGVVAIHGTAPGRPKVSREVCVDAKQIHVASDEAWRTVATLDYVVHDDARIEAMYVPETTPLPRLLGVLGALQREASSRSLRLETIRTVRATTCTAWLEETVKPHYP